MVGTLSKRNSAKRLAIFERLALDLSRHGIGKQDVGLCPLSLKEFGRDTTHNATLTEEHIIPQSAGGKESTLSCKSCNDLAGHGIDNHLARKIRFDDGLKGKRTKAQLRVNGVGAPVDVVIERGKIHVHARPTTQYASEKLAEAAQR